MARIRALLVDDHALFRESVARVLATEADLEMSHCASIRDALNLIQHQPFDLVLLDHDLGDERAFQFLPAAREIGFRGRVLIVTAWISDLEARRLIRQGVAGIFSKERPLSDLADTIRKIGAGQIDLDPRHAALAGDTSTTGVPGSGRRFNERQRRVLRFVLEGLSNKEIAWRLQISESYVKAILQSLFSKTGVRTRGQLVRVALEQYENQL